MLRIRISFQTFWDCVFGRIPWSGQLRLADDPPVSGNWLAIGPIVVEWTD